MNRIGTRYLGNAFSLGMLDMTRVWLDVRRLELEEAVSLLDAWEATGSDAWLSCVGHQDTAELLTAMLGRHVPMRRVSTSLDVGDQLLVAQYNGPRLPEGATSLPEGARIRWFIVDVFIVERT